MTTAAHPQTTKRTIKETTNSCLSLSFNVKSSRLPGTCNRFWGLVVRDQRYSEDAWSSDFEPRDSKAHSSGREQRVCERIRGAGDQHHPDQAHHHITRSTWKCIMSDEERKRLVWNIKKKVYTLNTGELFQLAKDINSASDADVTQLKNGDEESYINYIVTYMNSCELSRLPDQGMTVLLNLNDCIDEIVEQRATRTEMVTQPSIAPHNTDTSEDEYQRMLSNYEDLGRKLLACRTIPTTLPTATVTSHTHLPNNNNPAYSSIPRHELNNHSTSHSAPETMVSIRDIAMLQRREFRIHGGQIGDSVSDISFSNLCKQIDEGIKEGCTESDIIRGVFRMIKPGHFKDMLITKDDMTVVELKSFLQSHLGERSSTELFQELMTAKQQDHETPQQFLYRMISLKQKILFCSRQVNSDIKYDDHTVQSVFLHTVSQGIGLKHSDIRRELRPFLSDHNVSDETLLRHVIRITSDESERQRRLGQSTRHKVVHAHSAQFESYSGAKEMVGVAETAKDKTIQQLKVQIEALTTAVNSLKQSGMPKPSNSWYEHNETQPQRRQQLQQPPQQPAFDFQHPTLFPPSAMPLYNPETEVQSQTQYQSQRQYRSRPKTQFFSSRGSLQRQQQSRCHECTDKNLTTCSHCFICGAGGHRAVGCLRKPKEQGNGERSLQRDNQ